MQRSTPSRIFETGLEVEEQYFKWTIRNFDLVRKEKSIIDSQKIELTAGETIGHRLKSRWEVFLKEKMVDEKRWIGIYYRIISPSQSDPYLRNSFSEMTFSIHNETGRRFGSGRRHIPTHFAGGQSLGLSKLIDADDLSSFTGESLHFYLDFKLVVPIESKTSLETITKEFRVKLAAQAREALAGLMRNPIPFTNIKIISNDKKEFSMSRGILEARSDVFAAMLRTDMTEANSGVIQLPDISSKALQVLLNFLYTGELNPEWSHADVIVELTNAAGKYQLKDLLQFLDLTLGKVCQMENLGALVTLARQLSLKVAEEELIYFARRMDSVDYFLQMIQNTEPPEPTGVDSVDYFLQVTEPPVTEPASTANPRKRKRNDFD